MEFWQYDNFLSGIKLIKKGSLIVLKSSKSENWMKHEGTTIPAEFKEKII